MQGFTVQMETFELSVELLQLLKAHNSSKSLGQQGNKARRLELRSHRSGSLEQSGWRQLEAAAGIIPFCS